MRRKQFTGMAALTAAATATTLALVPASSVRGQQDKPPILQNTFENSEENWVAFGGDAKVSMTRDVMAKQGKGALQFTYNVKKGAMSAMILPTPNEALKNAESLRFWVFADHTTTIAVSMEEQGGGRYTAFFQAPARKWQQVILPLSDFILASDKNDPTDPNNRLDMDKVQGIGVLDFAQFFAQAEGTPVAKLFPIRTGPHTLLLDDFVVSADNIGGSTGLSSEETVAIDTFARPQVAWVSTDGVTLSSALGTPLDARSLQADYETGKEKITAFMRGMSPGLLANKKRLLFEVASEKNTMLLVQVEETTGGKYNTLVDVPGGKEVKKVNVPFDLFQPADDSKDNNNTLNLDKVKQVVILDVSGMVNGAEQKNTLWIGGLRAK